MVAKPMRLQLHVISYFIIKSFVTRCQVGRFKLETVKTAILIQPVETLQCYAIKEFVYNKNVLHKPA